MCLYGERRTAGIPLHEQGIDDQMKPPRFDYHAPATLEAAVEMKSSFSEDATILAGGQSLLPMLNMRLARPGALIDLRRIHELRDIEMNDDGVTVGAMVRQRALERDDDAFRVVPLLREALGLVAHAPIRNRGTVCGSIAHADPAAELPTVFRLLDGHVVAASIRGRREISAAELFVFHFTTALEPDEVIVEAFFPALPEGAGSAFVEFSRREGDFALVGAAAVVTDSGTSVCFSGVGSHPVLVESGEPATWDAAIDPPSDIHATAEFRRELVASLGARAVEIAHGRRTDAHR